MKIILFLYKIICKIKSYLEKKFKIERDGDIINIVDYISENAPILKKKAICLYGMVGNLVGNTRAGSCSLECLKQSYENFKINLPQDVDIYLHSWSVNLKDAMLELYKPKKFIIEKFDKPRDKFNDVYGLYSSIFKSVALMEDYYDIVYLSRFDLWHRKSIDLEVLDESRIHFVESSSLKLNLSRLHDIFFISNQENIKTLSQAYLRLDKYKAICMNGDKLDSHKILYTHCKQNNILNRVVHFRTYPEDVNLIREVYKKC